MGGDLPKRVPPGVLSTLPAHCSHTGKRANRKTRLIRFGLADAGSECCILPTLFWRILSEIASSERAPRQRVQIWVPLAIMPRTEQEAEHLEGRTVSCIFMIVNNLILKRTCWSPGPGDLP